MLPLCGKKHGGNRKSQEALAQLCEFPGLGRSPIVPLRVSSSRRFAAAQMALGFVLGHHGRHLFVQRRRQRGQSRFHVLMYGRFGYAQHAGRLSHRSARRSDIFRLAQHPALHRLIHAHPPRQSRYSGLSYAGMRLFSLATVRLSSRRSKRRLQGNNFIIITQRGAIVKFWHKRFEALPQTPAGT